MVEQLTEIWEAVQTIKEPPDVALVFYVAAHPEWYESLVNVLQYRFKWTVFAGCCAVVTADNDRELFKGKGVVVMLGWLPGIVVEAHVARSLEELPTEDEGPDSWHKCFGEPPQLQILFTLDHHTLFRKRPNIARRVFRGLDMAYPNTVRTGICGDGRHVFAGNESIRNGVVCLSFRGPIQAVTHSSDPWTKMGVPGIITSLSDGGSIATIDDLPAYQFICKQVTDPSCMWLEDGRLFLGVGSDWRLSQTLYEKRNISALEAESGIVDIPEARVGQQVQVFYHVQTHIDRFKAPEETSAIMVFARDNKESFRRATLPFGGVQARAAITNIEGFTCYEWRGRVGLYIGPKQPQ